MQQCQDILVGCSICRSSRRQRMRFATLLWSSVELGGILDANDDLAAGPVALIMDPNLQSDQPEQSNPYCRGNIFRSVP